MVKQVSKKEGLEITLKKFDESAKGVNDYIELFATFRNSISFGDGLMWHTVEEVITNTIGTKECIVPDENTNEQKLKDIYFENGKIHCIKEHRDMTGANLRDSVNEINKLVAKWEYERL